MKNKLIKTLCILLIAGWTACRPQPENVTDTPAAAPIYPDYAGVTIPYNIAPLNFLIRQEASAVYATVCGPHDSLSVSGKQKICFPAARWKQLLEKEKGETLTVILQARIKGKWLRYPAFTWYVAPDPVDGYLSYRLIEPGYEVWNQIRIVERNVQNFEEKILADNNLVEGNCMNCHLYGNHDGNLSMLHVRGEKGGTVLNRHGRLRKLRLQNEATLSSAVYGDFHPSGRYGVFSTNLIIPAFHAKGSRRLEVYDTASDLVVADFDKDQLHLSPLTSRKDVLETFPTFSADGQWIYYCAAPALPLPDSIHALHYSLCRIAFDAQQGRWGQQIDTLWNADVRQGSVCFPKASPDGKYLLYSVADYGTFPIWHRETDLQLLDLATGRIDSLATVNSSLSDTYHSWSSNSRWFVFASKRDDGQFGKPYFAYIDTGGKTGKPFVLPQQDPERYDNTLKSYNIPELSASSVPFDAVDIQKLYEQ